LYTVRRTDVGLKRLKLEFLTFLPL